jgi:hypothetical protein
MLKRTRVPALLVGFACLAGLLPRLIPAEPPVGGAADPATDVLDRRWPMQIESGADRIAIHSPRWESFSGDVLTGRAAASITPLGADEPAFGSILLECRTESDRVSRTARIVDIAVTQARFPGIAGAPDRSIAEALRKEIASRPLVLSLDRLAAQIESAEKEKAAEAQLRHTPPRIVFRSHPAVKVQYDGVPLLGEIEGSPLMRVVNTPFRVVLDPATKRYYLQGGGRWFSAPDALGPFQDAREVPAAVAAFAQTNPDLEAPAEPAVDARAAVVEIVTATEPTELIWTDGPPRLAPVAGTDLLYVTNTESDVFLLIPTQDYYVLLSGRWYAAPKRDGPWTHVPPDRLPADFAKIPPGGAKGDVLAHVAGTPSAREAVLDSDVPQAAAVSRQDAERPPVVYDGESQFAAVEGSPVRYAVNTRFSVLEVGGWYYCCYNGVWYDGASPLGPWSVCIYVPRSIYELPPSCPLYSVRYVYVYDVTPSVVYCGYLPGYLGYYPCDGVVVYGTGYGYSGWCGRRYYPRPCTFGYGAHYSGHYGGWGFSVGFGGPCAWFGVGIGHGGWASHGSYGYHHGGGWWGYGGYRHIDVHNDIVVNVNSGNGHPARVGPDRGTNVARPPGFASYVRGGVGNPAMAGGGSGSRGDVHPPAVTPGRDHVRGTGPSVPSAGPRPDRVGNGRDPVAGRDGATGDTRPPVVAPGRDRVRGTGPSVPPIAPRPDRVGNGRDPVAGRDGATGDTRPPVVAPRDRGQGGTSVPPAGPRPNRVGGTSLPDDGRPGWRVEVPPTFPPRNNEAGSGPSGRTDGIPRDSDIQRQPPAGDRANRLPGVSRPVEPPVRDIPPVSGSRRGGFESPPPASRGGSADRFPSVQRSSPPDRGSGSFGGGRDGGSLQGGGFSSRSSSVFSGGRSPSSGDGSASQGSPRRDR